MPNFIRFPRIAVLAAIALLALIPAASASAGGGLSSGGNFTGAKAKLIHGKAVAPSNAPVQVQKVIAAANKIRNKPYVYGGGHGSWKDRGYDCSGAVSFALHGGHLLNTPLDSSSLEKYGDRGKGSWISVYGNPGHAYMIVAGLRFDTASTPGNGPGWSKSMYSTPGKFKVRHPSGL